tara:strand:- start:23 stop:172 length:150 start_codon:yes stop_codon:yes gene_type:complete
MFLVVVVLSAGALALMVGLDYTVTTTSQWWEARYTPDPIPCRMVENCPE